MSYTVRVRGVIVFCDKPEEVRDLVACMNELEEAENRILAKYNKPPGSCVSPIVVAPPAGGTEPVAASEPLDRLGELMAAGKVSL